MRQLQFNALALHLGLVLLGAGGPFGFVASHCGQDQRQAHAHRLGIGGADLLVEQALLDGQVVLGRDFLGNHQVKACLRFAGVGDGGSAHFKIALGRRQLLSHGCFLGAHKGQAVTGGKHVEVGGAHAHHQVLPRGAQAGFGNGHTALGLRYHYLVKAVVQGLRQLHAQSAIGLRFVTGRVGARCASQASAVGLGAALLPPALEPRLKVNARRVQSLRLVYLG